LGVMYVAIDRLNSASVVAYAWAHSLQAMGNPGPSGPWSGTYRSSDSGASCVRCDTLPNAGLPLASGWKILGRGALLWTTEQNELTARDYLFCAIVRRDINPVTHYALDENFQGLYRSTDQGVTWAKILDS